MKYRSKYWIKYWMKYRQIQYYFPSIVLDLSILRTILKISKSKNKTLMKKKIISKYWNQYFSYEIRLSIRKKELDPILTKTYSSYGKGRINFNGLINIEDYKKVLDELLYKKLEKVFINPIICCQISIGLDNTLLNIFSHTYPLIHSTIKFHSFLPQCKNIFMHSHSD